MHVAMCVHMGLFWAVLLISQAARKSAKTRDSYGKSVLLSNFYVSKHTSEDAGNALRSLSIRLTLLFWSVRHVILMAYKAHVSDIFCQSAENISQRILFNYINT